MPPRKPDDLLIENARIMFRNFAGAERLPYNALGDRNFCVFLDPELGRRMEEDGWNIKYTKVREEGDVPEPYVQVSVEYRKGRPPRVILVSSQNKLDLGADEVAMLDIADLRRVDVILNPFPWEIKATGKSGIKAYLKTGVFIVNEDALELRYGTLNQAPDDVDIHNSDD